MLFCFLSLCWKLCKGRVGVFNPHVQKQLKPNVFAEGEKAAGNGVRDVGAESMHWKQGKARNFRDSQQGQTSGQCTSWLCLAGNQETQGNVRKTRTRAVEGEDHPLRGYSPRTGRYPWLQVSECPSPCSQGQPAPCPDTWRCGQAASRVGSSSSGSNSAPVGFDEGGSVRKRFTEN